LGSAEEESIAVEEQADRCLVAELSLSCAEEEAASAKDLDSNAVVPEAARLTQVVEPGLGSNVVVADAAIRSCEEAAAAAGRDSVM